LAFVHPAGGPEPDEIRPRSETTQATTASVERWRSIRSAPCRRSRSRRVESAATVRIFVSLPVLLVSRRRLRLYGSCDSPRPVLARSESEAAVSAMRHDRISKSRHIRRVGVTGPRDRLGDDDGQCRMSLCADTGRKYSVNARGLLSVSCVTGVVLRGGRQQMPGRIGGRDRHQRRHARGRPRSRSSVKTSPGDLLHQLFARGGASGSSGSRRTVTGR
jgi:hypothetical protein